MKLFESWKSYFYALLLHPTEAKVSIQSSNDNYDNYCLPHVEINKQVGLDNFQVIKEAIEHELSISVNVLHHASYQVDLSRTEIDN